MKRIYLIYLLPLLVTFSLFSQNHPVTVKDGFFYLNGKKFFMKGCGIENVRPGMEIDTPETLTPEWFSFDLARMQSAGFNTVRTWGAQTNEQLASVEGLGMKIIMGIWIPPHVDFTEPGFIEEQLEYVQSVLSYSKNYDEIIAYLIMNEPNTEDLVRDYNTTVKLWTLLADEIRAQHNGTPVGISAFPNISYVDMSMFDFIGYNIHPATNTSMDHCFDYPAFVEFVRDFHGYEKPFIVTEFGVSVASSADNSRFEGETQEERQMNGLLYMYRSMLDAGVGGSNVFINADGWYFTGDPSTHDNAPIEWLGLIEYQDVEDHIGTPRPAWYAFKEYNRAILTSPKNNTIYTGKIPIEIFGSDTVSYFTVSSNETEVFTSSITNNYFNDSIELIFDELNDTTLDFVFFDEFDNVVKQESITFLVSDQQVVLPKLEISADRDVFVGSENITLTYNYTHNSNFTVGNEIYYASEPVIDYTWSQPGYIETFSPGDYSFTKTYGTHFNQGVDIMCWPNRSVIVFSAGADVSYGDFHKRITGNLVMWRDTSYTPIPARIEAEEYLHMSGIMPGVTGDTEGWWHIYSFDAGDWMSYNLYASDTKDYTFQFRYACNSNSILTIKDGTNQYQIDLPSTGGNSTWLTYDTLLNFSEGNHKVRFETNKSINLNWFEIIEETNIYSSNQNTSFKVYPNPVTGNNIQIEFINNPMQNRSLVVEFYDVTGIMVMKKYFDVQTNQKAFSIDVSNLQNGIYFLNISGLLFPVAKVQLLKLSLK